MKCPTQPLIPLLEYAAARVRFLFRHHWTQFSVFAFVNAHFPFGTMAVVCRCIRRFSSPEPAYLCQPLKPSVFIVLGEQLFPSTITDKALPEVIARCKMLPEPCALFFCKGGHAIGSTVGEQAPYK